MNIFVEFLGQNANILLLTIVISAVLTLIVFITIELKIRKRRRRVAERMQGTWERYCRRKRTAKKAKPKIPLFLRVIKFRGFRK